MKTLLKIAAITTALAAASQAQAVSTYAGNGHKYAFVAANLSWQDALAAAAAATPIAGYNAYLVTITSAGEDSFVKALTGGALYVWAAGTDAPAEGTWTWAAGPEAGQTFYVLGGPVVGYSHWDAGEPNNASTENYLHLKANAGDWNDIFSTFPSGGYVVEYSLAVPEPADWALFVAGFGLIGAALRRNSRAIA
ncbi:MAG: PEPxxWA-CTERM sorting domain-containing protein [Sandarakinorhabdus sp.]|nr:PEPxxWA-CTERM sorting domain-containing protein [Sandarakinorhabdus sp.]